MFLKKFHVCDLVCVCGFFFMFLFAAKENMFAIERKFFTVSNQFESN